jgi:hypothetical protein
MFGFRKKSEPVWLMLDDSRIPDDERWIVVKDFGEFVEFIYNNAPNISAISFDYNILGKYTGYDCAKWFVEFYEVMKFDLPLCFVHSSSSIGSQQIIDLIGEDRCAYISFSHSYHYPCETNLNWRRIIKGDGVSPFDWTGYIKDTKLDAILNEEPIISDTVEGIVNTGTGELLLEGAESELERHN